MSFFEELQRRNVFRVAIGYVITAWLLLQVVDLVLENINAPDWVMQVFMLALAIGFPLAVFFAWAFEMTPEGVKLERDVDRSQSVTRKTGQKMNRNIIIALGLVVVFLLFDRFVGSGSTAPDTIELKNASPHEQLNLTPAPPEKSIAVLPFADLSQAKDQEWFADGLAEEILNALAKTPDLLVSSRTSTFRYKGSTLDLPDIAKELGVAHVLEGSVRSSGKRIRVTAQLIRASDGFHVWSENYDRDVADMIEIQEDLALNIARALETTMDPVALAAMMNAGTRSVDAYEAYLRGLATSSKGLTSDRSENFLAAYQDFESARSIDPKFAAAHLRSADFWKVQLAPNRIDSGLTEVEPRQMLLEFNQRIDQAIANAKTATGKKGYMAYKASVELRLREAIPLYQAYLQERPNDDLARFELVSLASFVSDEKLQKELLAYWRERGATDQNAAFSYMNDAYQAIDPSEAADFGINALRRWPNNTGLLYQTHRTLMWAGRILEAKELADRFSRLSSKDNNILQARQACAEGRRTDAEAIYNAIDPEDIYGRSERWHILMLLGREREAAEVLQPYTDSGVPYQIASLLDYEQFDPTPFPAVMAVLEREGINRPPPVEIPFKCPPPEQVSIAVLPFVNMSADAENEFFSDGISEEILNVLARIPDLKVAARTSAFAFKGSNSSISRIADELGVNHILEGSVRKSGNQVRVTAQLIKADDGFHLWSENYDRELTNIFVIQDEIAGSIADALKVSLELESSTAGNLTGTRSIKAYEHYLKGMSLWHLRTVDSLRKSIEEFEAAIALDLQFAKAHAGLALSWSVIDGYVTMDSKTTRANTRAAANRALSLDANNVEALAALGQVTSNEFKYDEAVGLYERAIELNPSFATAYQWYGGVLNQMGNAGAGLASYQQAWQLDPRSRIIGANLAKALKDLGRNQEAIDLLQGMTSFAPDFPDLYEQLMHISIATGDCVNAVRHGERITTMLHKKTDSTMVYQDLCQTADPEIRTSAIETILSWPAPEFSAADNPSLSYTTDLAVLLVDLGEFDAALTVTRKFLERESHFILIQFRSNRTQNGITFYCDPRVQSLFEEVSIPPAEGETICE